jgi:hypothetical protein
MFVKRFTLSFGRDQRPRRCATLVHRARSQYESQMLVQQAATLQMRHVDTHLRITRTHAHRCASCNARCPLTSRRTSHTDTRIAPARRGLCATRRQRALAAPTSQHAHRRQTFPAAAPMRLVRTRHTFAPTRSPSPHAHARTHHASTTSASPVSTSSLVRLIESNPLRRCEYATRFRSNQPQRRGRPVVVPNS